MIIAGGGTSSLAYSFTLAIGLVAGALSGIIGAGSSIILLPVLVYQFGPKQAVPIMAVASLMLNVGKVIAWWREINWRAFAAYLLPGVPAAALGARTLLALPAVAFAGKFVVRRLSVHTFEYLLDALLLFSGLSMIWQAFDR
jgi:uncharacterized membrane protein YfcA